MRVRYAADPEPTVTASKVQAHGVYNCVLGLGEAQLVKCLHKDLSSISRTHKKQPGVGTSL